VKGPTERRDGETTEESGDTVLTLPKRCALLTISGLLCENSGVSPKAFVNAFGGICNRLHV